MSSKKLKKNIKICDFFVILCFFCAFFVFFSKISVKKSKLSLFIYSEDKQYQYDLSKNMSFTIKNSYGQVSFVIKDKEVFITDSTCKNKICINSGSIKECNKWLCCAPNKIFALIKDGESIDSRENRTGRENRDSAKGKASNDKSRSPYTNLPNNETGELDAVAF